MSELCLTPHSSPLTPSFWFLTPHSSLITPYNMSTIVQDKYSEVKDRFRSLFNVYEGVLNGQRDHQLHSFRTAAIQRLDTLDFPTRRDENWKYTSLNRLLQLPLQDSYAVEIDQATLEQYVIPELNACRLVLVNGILQTALSDLDDVPAGFQLQSLEQALEDADSQTEVKAMLDAALQNEHNPFSALNVAFAKNGFFLKVAAKAVVERPIHIIHIAAPTQDPVFINPLLLVFITLIHTSRSLSSPSLSPSLSLELASPYTATMEMPPRAPPAERGAADVGGELLSLACFRSVRFCKETGPQKGGGCAKRYRQN